MKKIFLSVLFLSLGYYTVAQEVATITFDSLVVDYGTINKGDDGVRQFKFTNTGTADLEITQVRSSCGCTIPKKPSGPVAPGASDVIEVKYDTERVGPIRKTITVASNASNGMVALKIKGEVLEVKE
ncbi:MAG: DUF1573 domain-containing protein [Bacteroidetes bacterium]|nr:DUF1573 domain-containing protein [Bacteroidota bacterium]MDA0889099.1 DUF1573 domain-containing protein [Bacteroidota bacterium]MDA1084899.1 DUF1573 domain-containing protein [Bacteroidota bacterium]